MRKLDSFILCCYAKRTIPTLMTCESQANGFSSCEDMLKSTVIRVGIWIQGLFASFGNFAVILWWTVLNRKKSSNLNRSKSNVQSLLLRNLALADFLMGIYLLFIAIQDAKWKGEYVDHDVEWRSGVSCQIAGAISTLSSEVSVLMLVVLTADRFSTIVFDFKGKRLNLKTARFVCFFVWIIGIAIAFSPLLASSYFHDETTGVSFYGRSTVCLPFQLSSDKPAGWEYSVAIFMGFNGAAFAFILVGYVAIFIKVQQSARSVQSAREPSSLGTRIMFIVLTDFFCWMPVIVLGVLSLVGQFQDPTGQVYAVIAVFVLPVNSSINPVMYTFATPQAKKAFHQLTSRSFRIAMNCSIKVCFVIALFMEHFHSSHSESTAKDVRIQSKGKAKVDDPAPWWRRVDITCKDNNECRNKFPDHDSVYCYKNYCYA
ncbi:G-protein coupled receptor GRL101 [Exaiptasia diaphana]|nr:G-protein coupled receptor GRL101 [Exaiptasia diaphana]